MPPITGFKEVSLLSMINFTGRVPVPDSILSTLEDIRQRSARPVVVFPECTTSNGRGLLRFAEVFRQTIPVKGYQVFIMSIRCVICVVWVASWLKPYMQIRSPYSPFSYNNPRNTFKFGQPTVSPLLAVHLVVSCRNVYSSPCTVRLPRKSTVHGKRDTCRV